MNLKCCQFCFSDLSLIFSCVEIFLTCGNIPLVLLRSIHALNFHLQDDTLKQQMNSFLLSTQSQHEIQALDNKVRMCETFYHELFYHEVSGRSIGSFVKCAIASWTLTNIVENNYYVLIAL